MTRDAIVQLQPPEYTEVGSTESTIFIWWPAQGTGPFHPKFAKIMARRKCHPFGTFPGGDIVCWSAGGLFVVLHDSFEIIETEIGCEEFFQRLANGDPQLEGDVYFRARRPA